MKRTAPRLLLLLLPACGGGTPAPAAVEAPPEAANRCEVKPALAATAKPTPRASSCTSRPELAAATDACNGGDAAQCYVVGVCFIVQVSMIGDKDPVQRARAVEQGKKALRVACDGGIAEGCDNRAGMIEDQATNQAARREACADIIRGCHLGKQVDCAECLGCPD